MAAPQPRFYEWVELADQPTPSADFLMDGGKRRTLADFKGQVVLLNLWATWCTPCLKELPTLEALEEKYAADGLVVLPLSLDTLDYAQLRAFVDKLDLPLPHLAQDTTRSYQRALPTRGLPATFLIDRNGVIRARFEGTTDWTGEEHAKKIEALLKE